MFTKKIIRHAAAILGAAVMFTALAGGAHAQVRACGPRSEVISWLESRFQERQAGFGLVGDRAVMELYTSSAGTWTLIVTDPLKRTCFVASGHSWVDVPPPATQAWTVP